jgi:hypothetical protein
VKKKKSQVPPSSNAQLEEIKINKSMMYATWASSIVALFALGLSIYSIWLSKENRKEDLEIVYARMMYDVPMKITEKSDASLDTTTGLLTAYVEFYLSNNGDISLSIIEHDITEIKDEFGTNEPVQYFPSQNGYYRYSDGKFIPSEYPLTIEGGHSQRIYSQVELTMAPKAYRLIKEKFGEELSSGLSLSTIKDFLFSNNIDLYGNKVERNANNSPNVLITNEQIFLAKFTTSRNTEKSYLFSLYVYNGLYFMPSP